MDKNKTDNKGSEKVDDQVKLSLVVNKTEDANIEFIDHVQASWNPEVVILSLIQKNLGGASPQGPDGNPLNGRLVSQAALTWPHIVRLRNLLTKAIEENKVAAMKELEYAFKEGDRNE